MNIATILIVGIENRAVQGQLSEYGYHAVSARDTASAVATDDPYAMVIISSELVQSDVTAALERVRFLCENAPVVVYLATGTRASGGLLAAMKTGTVEFILEEEVQAGLFCARIDSILLRSRLDAGLHDVQDHMEQKRNLQAELNLRSEVLELQQSVNANILSSLTSGVLIMDLQGTVITCNTPAMRMLNLPENQQVGADYRVILPDVFRTLVSRLLSLKPAADFPPYRKIPMGQRFLGVSAHRMREYTGMQNGIMLFMEDITEQEEAANALQQAERLATVGTMLSGVAHELRNPLAIISARTQRALAKTETDPEWMQRSLESILKQSERCATLVNSLLSFARQSTAVLGMHAVQEILDEALSYASYDKAMSTITVVKEYGEGLKVFGDRSRFVQVFLNLMVNAADAMGGAGTLGLRTQAAQDGGVESVISDTGPGIDPAVAAKVFDPFFTTKDTGKGTGLGLAIVYKIVSESGGAVRFESRPGDTTFFVRLPARSFIRHG